jgi:hypothetical protein
MVLTLPDGFCPVTVSYTYGFNRFNGFCVFVH